MRRAWLLFLLAIFPATSSAQSLLERSPNISGGWVGVPGTVYFNFLHRFTNSGAPERQVTNYPTFLLGYAPLHRTLIGVNYATRSDIAPRFPNEYEVFARYAPVSFATAQAGYNNAAESVDGELGVNYSVGPVRLLGAARAFSNGFASDTARFALAAGATFRITRWVALAGDVATLLAARDSEDLAWAAALQVGIPYTPHTLSLQATNTNTATLQGQSRGMDDVRYGFEFTIPITLSRFFSRTANAHDANQDAEAGAAAVGMKELKFTPSTVRVRAGHAVVWKNNDQVAHTVTAEDRSWTSPLIEPGRTYRHVFDRPGTYNIVCTPHPFMKAVVEVTP